MTDKSGSASDGVGEARQEVGGRASSSLHPPHAPESDSDEQIQNETESRGDVPVMPANASGTDKVSSEDQDQGIDSESMYDRRPAEDKDHPASS